MGFAKKFNIISKKTPHLMVFFTYGNSLKTWAETGLMGRELLIYKKMIRKGFKISFLTFGDHEDYNYSNLLDGINIVPVFSFFKKSDNRWINLIYSFLLPFNKKFKKIFADADIYKTNQMSGVWVPLIAGILYKKPLIVRCGYQMLRNMLRREKKILKWATKGFFGYALEFMAYTRAYKIIISNRSDKNYIKRLFPVKNDKLLLIRNIIDTDLFCKTNAETIETNNKSALFIGRIEQCKNIENLIYGSAKANCCLDIIGKGTNEDYCKKIAKTQNVAISFHGIKSNRELPEIIRRHGLFILPSFYEGNPKSLLEAMACESVVLGTNVPGINELIDEGKTGFLCNTDALSISIAIQNIFNTPREELDRIAGNARQFVLKECSVERVLHQEMSVYEELLS